MKKTFLPVFSVMPVISAKKSVFQLKPGSKEFFVQAPGSLMSYLVDLCDGKHSLEQVLEAKENKWERTSVRGLMTALRCRKLVIDASQLCDTSWSIVEDPVGYPLFLDGKAKAELVKWSWLRHKTVGAGTIFKRTYTRNGNLIERRSSVRAFSGKVSLETIVNMSWSAYGETVDGRRTVPSAGALYPLVIHLVLFENADELVSGIYRVHFGSTHCVSFELVSLDVDRFARSLIDPMVVTGSHGVFVISGSFSITAQKYGTRSMLFVPLEAGHAAQNVMLSATELGVASLEVGGFKEHLLGKAIGLEKSYHPLTMIVFGAKDLHVPSTKTDDKVEVQWAHPSPGGFCPTFAMASARLVGRKSWSHGRDASPTLAYTKAVAEAREWASCGCLPDTMLRARYADVEAAVDPRQVIRFDPKQYGQKGFPFRPFDEGMEYQWTVGRNEFTGKPAYVLADLVYFPYFPKHTPYYAYANSSGVAAHPSLKTALEKSVLELVERDSFMIAYLTRMEFQTIRESSLPDKMQKRVRELRKAGFMVWFKDHSIDLAPVVSVIAQSEDLACTICSACSSFDIEYAASHALMEAESCVVARLQNGKPKPIDLGEVYMPLDHERLYDQERYFRRADFLKEGGSTIPFKAVGRNVSGTWDDLLSTIDVKGWKLFTVPFTLPEERGGNAGLSIVRSIVPGMVPMTFGHGQEPAGMDRLFSVAHERGGRRLTYKELTKFPHPFG